MKCTNEEIRQSTITTIVDVLTAEKGIATDQEEIRGMLVTRKTEARLCEIAMELEAGNYVVVILDKHKINYEDDTTFPVDIYDESREIGLVHYIALRITAVNFSEDLVYYYNPDVKKEDCMDICEFEHAWACSNKCLITSRKG